MHHLNILNKNIYCLIQITFVACKLDIFTKTHSANF